VFVGSFLKQVLMAEQPHTSVRSPCAMPTVGWSGVKLGAIGNTFFGVMNHVSFGGGGIMVWGFFMVRAP
jgi:hypothetical protein